MVANGFEAAILIAAAICFAIFYGGQVYGTRIMEREAIARGYASFCPDTGDFAWVGECEQGDAK